MEGFALPTMQKNCEDNARAGIGGKQMAKEASYGGETATKFYALLGSFTSIHFNDRKTTMTAGTVDEFGEGLRDFAKSNRGKTEPLLILPPTYYPNTVENMRATGLQQ